MEQQQCPLYASKINLDSCEACKEGSYCGLRLLISKVNRMEQRILQLERGGPTPYGNPVT